MVRPPATQQRMPPMPPKPGSSAPPLSGADQLAGEERRSRRTHDNNPHSRCSQYNALRSWGPAAPRARWTYDEETGLPLVRANQQQGPRHVPDGGALALVQFKFGRLGTHFSVSGAVPGDFVLVEGDGGTDLGVVIATRHCDTDASSVPQVLRVACAAEIELWTVTQVAWERWAEGTARHLMNKVPLHIVHAELQYDESKVTFHFSSADPRPDFRARLGLFYRVFKMRVWFARHTQQPQPEQLPQHQTQTDRYVSEEDSRAEMALPPPPPAEAHLDQRHHSAPAVCSPRASPYADGGDDWGFGRLPDPGVGAQAAPQWARWSDAAPAHMITAVQHP
eukprot:TRINITY_DN136_c0_g3_i3.p1 TRINITY_DN136_c0_g3~~TRINITY_DN136_c0_g3_i3.p1  ORF type:complete len:382 (+),score=123.63 TRINITY_DN136_c0_g3_i3:139-1146(+)